jgi:hypothetical protein
MKYLRWPAKTRKCDVPALSITLTEALAARKRREAYLKYAYPAKISHRNN